MIPVIAHNPHLRGVALLSAPDWRKKNGIHCLQPPTAWLRRYGNKMSVHPAKAKKLTGQYRLRAAQNDCLGGLSRNRKLRINLKYVFDSDIKGTRQLEADRRIGNIGARLNGINCLAADANLRCQLGSSKASLTPQLRQIISYFH